ncbi:hypothetical protein ACFSR7_07275 [Cohnella sp. GCM10020058]|uniref:hypothetical protein n=1 Tax=Cohnella sp. GCM10020058 TaxID=3317330 RepID=UPI003629B87D
MTESETIGNWASVPVKLLDIRLATLLRRGEAFVPYRMPAHGFQLPEALKQYADGGTALSQEAFVASPADYYFYVDER